MNINQHYWATLLSRALCHGTLPSRSLRRPKYALLKSKVGSLLYTLLAVLRTLNSTISWSLHARLSLIFTFPTSPSLLVRTRSSIAPLLVGSSITWRRKLSSTHSRNLLDCLHPAVLSCQQTSGWLKPSWQVYDRRCSSLSLSDRPHQPPVGQLSQGDSHGLSKQTPDCGTSPVTIC